MQADQKYMYELMENFTKENSDASQDYEDMDFKKNASYISAAHKYTGTKELSEPMETYIKEISDESQDYEDMDFKKNASYISASHKHTGTKEMSESLDRATFQ